MHTEWIKDSLWEGGYFDPDAFAEKRVLFSHPWRGPLVALLFEKNLHLPSWRCDSDGSYIEALFARLRAAAEVFPCSWCYITDPDDALSVVIWEGSVTKLGCHSGLLGCFEHEPAEQGGSQYLCLIFDDRKGLFVFSRKKGFELSYYGSDERWRMVALEMGLPTGQPGQV
jgi:hypothetical protein